MISNPGAVYRSVDPHHLEIARKNEVDRSEAVVKADQAVNDIVPGAEPYGVQYDSGSFWINGFSSVPEGTEVPAGLRWDTKKRGRHLVPAKRTDEGKAIAKVLDGLAFGAAPLGEVSQILTMTDGDRRWFCSANIEIIGEQVFATYHHPLSDQKYGNGRPSDRQRVEDDPGWVPIPLSEFYAAREAQEALRDQRTRDRILASEATS